jgi:hypothetical protein
LVYVKDIDRALLPAKRRFGDTKEWGYCSALGDDGKAVAFIDSFVGCRDYVDKNAVKGYRYYAMLVPDHVAGQSYPIEAATSHAFANLLELDPNWVEKHAPKGDIDDDYFVRNGAMVAWIEETGDRI